MAFVYTTQSPVQDLPVWGNTRLPENIETHVLQCLDHSSSTATLTCIGDSIIQRSHGNGLIEVSATISANELFGDGNITLPYGANPRNPVLCAPFDKIFTTVTSNPNAFILKNTGIDVFCSEAIYNQADSKVVLKFTDRKHGIANGGLTTSVLRYCSSKGYDISGIRVSLRIWASADFTPDVLVDAADSRNLHRKLSIADRLNSLGAFEHLKECLSDENRASFSFNTGDENATPYESEDVLALCWILYGFTQQQGEAHPITNPNPQIWNNHTVKRAGRVDAKKTGLNSMKLAVNLDE